MKKPSQNDTIRVQTEPSRRPACFSLLSETTVPATIKQNPKHDTFNPQQRNISIPSNIGPHFAKSPARKSRPCIKTVANKSRIISRRDTRTTIIHPVPLSVTAYEKYL